MTNPDQPYQKARMRVDLFHLETEENWDYVGGQPASSRTHAEALAFLSLSEQAGLPEPSGVTLGHSGRISVIWYSDKFYIYNHFVGDGECTFIAIGQGPHRGKKSISEKLSVGKLPEKLSEIMSGGHFE